MNNSNDLDTFVTTHQRAVMADIKVSQSRPYMRDSRSTFEMRRPQDLNWSARELQGHVSLGETKGELSWGREWVKMVIVRQYGAWSLNIRASSPTATD